MAIWDAVKKLVPGAAFLTAGATGALALVVSPYGPFQPKPNVCAAQQTCVIVAGLYRDVNIGVGAGDQAFGFDIDDQLTRKTVGWIANAPEQVTVYKMPEEIVIPELGTPNSTQARAQTMARAREIGRTYHAALVVIGEVNSDNSIDLQFVNPASNAQTLKPTEYAVPQTGVADHFLDDFAAALAAAQGRRAPESVVAAAPQAATNVPAVGNAASTPQSTPVVMPTTVVTAQPSMESQQQPQYQQQRQQPQGTVRQLMPVSSAPAQESSQQNQYERLVAGFLQWTQEHQVQGASRAPNLSDEIVALQLGNDDRWNVTLNAGVPYTFIGACDNDCNNIDIELTNAAGQVVGSDMGPNDAPIVNFTPPSTGRYTVRTILRTCANQPCYVGTRALVRGG